MPKLVRSRPGEPDKEYVLDKDSLTIGRAQNNDLVLRDPRVSRLHARLDRLPDGSWQLSDLGSVNGTLLNGLRITTAPLVPGDVALLGDTTLRLELAPPRADPALVALHTAADVEATLAETTLPVALSDTTTPRLVVYTPTRTWEVPLTATPLAIGRHPDNDLDLDDPSVSRHHARVERRGDDFVLSDLGSSNGSWLGSTRVTEHVLREGENIRIGPARLVFKRGFAAADLTLVDAPANASPSAPAASPAGQAPRRPVVVVPGFMGSELWRGADRVWPNVRLLLQDPDLFRLPSSVSIEARGPIQEVVIVPNLIKLEQYGRLGDYLEEGLGYQRGLDLFEFGYDWRQDNRLSAQRLANQIGEWRKTTGSLEPVTILAHSMGCLVSRYYVEKLGGREVVGRLVLMGGPHAGTPKALTSLVAGPNLLPLGLLGDKLREVLTSFPSLYQILPTYDCALDQSGQPIHLLSDESWVPEPARPHLRSAAEFRRELGNRSSVPAVSIFGYGLKTVTGLTVQRAPDGVWKHVQLESLAVGDTTIPQASAVLQGSEIHPVRQYHGSLYVDNDVKMRLKLELEK